MDKDPMDGVTTKTSERLNLATVEKNFVVRKMSNVLDIGKRLNPMRMNEN